jgi:4-alpha-glucanotransferase
MTSEPGTGTAWIKQQQEEHDDRRPPARACGILTHPTSLPGPHGIGDLGPATFAFLDWLHRAKQNRWQILPLTPPGFGDSPYQSYSAFAGNPLLISLERLRDDGLLNDADLEHPAFPAERVDFDAVRAFKTERLRRAAERFQAGQGQALRSDYERFVSEQAGWLADYALFTAIKSEHDDANWTTWPEPLRLREPDALDAARSRLTTEIGVISFIQFIFDRQWSAVHERATQLGISIIGDIPIFVSEDSADVWANASGFQLDEHAQPAAVAGVPPDYFSETGQLWGNPLYDWEQMAADGYRWWIERFRAVYRLVDIARIDHFRGFANYWSIPAGEETAINGSWQPGPGRAVFDAVRAELGDLPVVAEDLGLITSDVDALRKALGYPGMSVLQFAFGSGSDNLYLPHNLTRDTVIYPGTHDNDTTAGWYAQTDERARDHVRRYLQVSGHDIAWDLIHAAWLSVAETAIVQLQDVLSLPTEARMNMPGRATGNWGWRVRSEALTDATADRLAALTDMAGRL